MKMTSIKPYYIRARYDWIVDNGLTPYLLVNAEYPDLEIPMEYVKDGKIVLNISPKACRGLHLENDRIIFSARFSGKTMQIYLHPGAVLAIYAQENGEGQEFIGHEYDMPVSLSARALTAEKAASVKKKPALTLVKQDKSVD